MRFVLLLIDIVVMILFNIYFYRQGKKFSNLDKIENKYLKIGLIISPGILLFIFSLFKMVVAIVIGLHFIVFSFITNLIMKLVRRKYNFKRNYEGMFVIIFTCIYLAFGFYFGTHVYKTEYTIKSDKISSNLKIAQISDSHIGSSFGGDGFRDYIKDISKLNPDLVVITGDFVDDDTKKSDMVKACSALGNISPTYGVYFIYGNHDKGYYNGRDFSTKDLVNELEKNNVKILEDEAVLINNEFYIIGRKDKSDSSRAKLSDIVSTLDSSKYMICLDHQPNDYNNEKNIVDLVLSGHTHGGNLIPINIFVHLANDMTYGKKRIGNTDFIVTSGISSWGIPINTCTIQEYVIINVKAS